MGSSIAALLTERFSDLEDPRTGRAKRHELMDVGFSEDNSRARVGHSPGNFSAPRRMALNMLKSENTLKVGVAAKRKRAGWDENTCSKSSLSKMRLPCRRLNGSQDKYERDTLLAGH